MIAKTIRQIPITMNIVLAPETTPFERVLRESLHNKLLGSAFYAAVQV
jgi:hypothetical protein